MIFWKSSFTDSGARSQLGCGNLKGMTLLDVFGWYDTAWCVWMVRHCLMFLDGMTLLGAFRWYDTDWRVWMV